MVACFGSRLQEESDEAKERVSETTTQSEQSLASKSGDTDTDTDTSRRLEADTCLSEVDTEATERYINEVPSCILRECLAAQRLQVKDIFAAYCGYKPDMDAKTFMRMCRNAGLIDNTFTTHDAELVFAKCALKGPFVPGQRHISERDFVIVLKEIAVKKKVSLDFVQSAVTELNDSVLVDAVAECAHVEKSKDKITTDTVFTLGGRPTLPKGAGMFSPLSNGGVLLGQR